MTLFDEYILHQIENWRVGWSGLALEVIIYTPSVSIYLSIWITWYISRYIDLRMYQVVQLTDKLKWREYFLKDIYIGSFVLKLICNWNLYNFKIFHRFPTIIATSLIHGLCQWRPQWLRWKNSCEYENNTVIQLSISFKWTP